MEVVRHHASNQDWIVYKCIFYCDNCFFQWLDFAIEDDFGKNRIQSYSEMRIFDVCE